jgi:molybdopterin synthase catalytic subunit
MNQENFTTHWMEGPIPAALTQAWLMEASANHGIGSCGIFCGQVRADFSGEKRVKGIAYSVYESMANQVLHDFIVGELSTFRIECIKIAQSKGFVACGELSLLVLIATAHRKELLTVQALLVEFLKFKVPVWKKEIFLDESYRWINS